MLTDDIRGLYLGIQQWADAEGEYRTHAWLLAVFGVLNGMGEGHCLQSCGPLSGVPQEGRSSREWLHLLVAWEGHWP